MVSLSTAALTVSACVLVLLLLTGGYWFLRQYRLVDAALVFLLLLAGLFLLLRLTDFVIMLVLAGVLAFILASPVERLTGVMPRALAIGVVYLGLTALLAIAGLLLIPRVVQEARHFARELPGYVQHAKEIAVRATAWYGGEPAQAHRAVEAVVAQLQAAAAARSGSMERILLGALGWMLKGAISMVLSIYLLVDQKNLRSQFVTLFPEAMRAEVQESLAEVSLTFSRYLRGQATVMLFVAAAVTAVLLAFRIPYSFFIGLMAGTLEVIPYFGAIMGAVPAVTLGFMHSSASGIALILLFLLINQIEGHVVIPLVMGRRLAMRPLTILLALIAGEQLYGVAGMVLAVPVLSLLRVLLPHVTRHYQRYRSRAPDDLQPS
jgi:predicted PurR-regulated permease PerM